MKHAFVQVSLPTLLLTAMLLVACGSDTGSGSNSENMCKAGSTTPCMCPSGMASNRRCNDTGTAFGVCICGAVTNLPVGQPTTGQNTVPVTTIAGSPAANGGAAGSFGTGARPPTTPPAAPSGGNTPPVTPPPTTPPVTPPPATPPVTPPPTTGAAGAPATTPPPAGAAGAPAATGDQNDVETVRQVCVDTINMYRSTKMLGPLMRAPADTEKCSDAGAMKDGDSMQAHGSAFSCKGTSAQNTCPGYPVGGFGAKTLADALKQCLLQMWNEGEPPVSRADCQKDYQGCFLKYGHYLNMTSNFKAVSCGFYKMTNGSWWMNQDFL